MDRLDREDGGTRFEALAAELEIEIEEPKSAEGEEAAVFDRAAYLALYRDQAVGNAVGHWAKKHGGGWSQDNIQRAYEYLYSNRSEFQRVDEGHWFETAYSFLMELTMLDKAEARLRDAA